MSRRLSSTTRPPPQGEVHMLERKVVSPILVGLALVATAWIAPAPLLGQAGAATGAIRGTVRHAASNNPLSNAQVSVAGTRLGAATRDDGTYLISRVPTGSH